MTEGVKVLLRGIAFGLAAALIPILITLGSYLSRGSAYDRIQLGMSEQSALDILWHKRIYSCDSVPTSYRCSFDDFWRVYTIGISVPQHVVTLKAFQYKWPRQVDY